MRLILAPRRLGASLRSRVLFRLAHRDMIAANRLARRATDRIEASALLPQAYTASRVPVCLRARWR